MKQQRNARRRSGSDRDRVARKCDAVAQPVWLQQGLYLAITSINNTLVTKGILSREEIDLALRRAEQSALGDDRLMEI